MLKKYLKINRWDLNFILTMIGFSFFCSLISNSTASIAYRVFALLVALMCLWKSGFKITKSRTAKLYLFALFYVSIQALIGVFWGEYADFMYSMVKYNFLLFNVGVLWIPLLAFICGFDKIQWEKVIPWTFFLMFITVVKADLGTFTAEIPVSGRYDMGRLSPLAFGDNGSYLVLMSAAFLATRDSWLSSRKIPIIVVLVVAILAGLFGLFIAGSRGPFVGCITGLLFLIYVLRSKDRKILITLIIVLMFSGVISLSKFENFAPTLYWRLTATIEDNDMSGRDILFEESFEKFQDNMILGSNPVTLETEQFSTCHNVYLETLQGGGIVIFMFFVCAFLSVAFGSLKIRGHLLQHTGYLFLFLLFFYNIGRGLSGIMLTSNAIYSFSFIGCCVVLYYIKQGYLITKSNSE